MHANLPVAVHVFLRRGSQALLVQRAHTGFRDGEWSVPAGRLDIGESVRQTAARETAEEVGVLINIEDLGEPLVMNHRDERGERLYFFFTCSTWRGEPRNMEPKKCNAINWFDVKNLPPNTVDHVKDALTKIKNGAGYMEYGF